MKTSWRTKKPEPAPKTFSTGRGKDQQEYEEKTKTIQQKADSTVGEQVLEIT